MHAIPLRRYTIGGETLSRDEIIHKYLHLVKYVAGRISMSLPANVEIDDLINDGVFGLIDAIEKYDNTRAVKFETYAITRINGAILDALRSLDWVPRGLRQKARELERASQQLEAELGRAPRNDELAERMELTKEEFDKFIARVKGSSVVSLEDAVPTSRGHEVSLADTLEDKETDITGDIEQQEVRAELVRAVEALSTQESTVIRLYYFEGKTLKQIKGTLGVSESRVSQIHAQAVLHLRQRLHELREELG